MSRATEATQPKKHDWSEAPEGEGVSVLTCSKCGVTMRMAAGPSARLMADGVAPECK